MNKAPLATILFFISRSVSLLGNTIAGVILPLALLTITGDVMAAGTLALFCAIPQVLMGIVGGAVLDRYNRKRVSIISDIISAAAVAALPIVHATVGLSFWWFVLFGILGAIGDIPGMTARDALSPALAKHDNIDLQRFTGISQSVETLMVILGPAAAGILLGTLGQVNALWVTAAFSFSAALITACLPSSVGAVESTSKRSLLHDTLTATGRGVKILFATNPILRTIFLLTLFASMVLAGFQSLILPVYFTFAGEAALLGYVLSCISVGILVSSGIYALLMKKLSRRAWYVLSILVIGIGVAVLATLHDETTIFIGAFVMGFGSGPLNSLAGFFLLDLIPDEHRGTVMGTQNSLLLVIMPLAIFAVAALVEAATLQTAAWILGGLWIAVTAWALATPSMRHLQ